MPTPQVLPDRVSPDDEPSGLADHVSDRYAMRINGTSGRPQPKRKVATLSESRETRPAPRDAPADGERPKRKRHVATHNPDGSIKSCGVCGQTKTPMWRRGPKGPSQLCNACGAKWKAGRLTVPEVPPPPILDSQPEKQAYAGVVRASAAPAPAAPAAPATDVPAPAPALTQAPTHVEPPM